MVNYTSLTNYIIDTSSILSQKDDEPHRRTINKTLWHHIDDLIEQKRIVTCSEIIEEVNDDTLRKWYAELHGVVGALPFGDNSFDLVLSLNGFHAFPDKEAAFQETFRVLKPSGTFCGCFYIAGQNKRTDWFIDHLYTPKGFFTPPFDTVTSLYKRLSKLYESVELQTVESMAYFTCRKGE